MIYSHTLLKFRTLTFAIILTVFASVLSITNAFAQSPTVDLTFKPKITRDLTSNYTGNAAILPDGKIILYGRLDDLANPIPKPSGFVKRINADGTDDPSFDCAVCYALVDGNVLVQPDGKIIYAGFYSPSYHAAWLPLMIRINPDGGEDATFSVADPVPPSSNAKKWTAMAIQPDGKILAMFTSSSMFTGRTIYRLNTNGSVDNTFTPIALGVGRQGQNAAKVIVQPDGKILAGGDFPNLSSNQAWISRYNSNGTQDSTFESPTITPVSPGGPNWSTIAGFDVQPDGKIVIAGSFGSVNGVNRKYYARLMPNGNVDTNFVAANFDSNFGVFFGFGEVKILTGGKIIIQTDKLRRFNSDGTLDKTYNQDAGMTPASRPVFDSSERAVILGDFSGVRKFARINTDGSLDQTFNPRAETRERVSAQAAQADGKVVIAGPFDRIDGASRNKIARLNFNGTLDTSFDPGDGFDGEPTALAMQADGKILVIGVFSTYHGVSRIKVVRLNSDGSLDTSFNLVTPAGDVFAVAAQPNGKVLIGGSFFSINGVTQRGLAQLNSDGSLDTSWAPIFGNPFIRAILVQPDGKIMVGGDFTGANGFNRQNLVRLNADASLDTTFNAGNIASSLRIIQQPDGKYLIQSGSVFRLNNDGSRDNSFTQPSITTQVTGVETMALQADGSIIIGGFFDKVNNVSRPNLARILSNGALDTAFLPAGANGWVQSIINHTAGRVIVGGDFTLIATIARANIARITTTPFQSSTPFDYDGDGKADISVFRPSENRWYVLRSSDFGVTQQIFGISGDIAAPADFDGDSRTDFAVFRPSTGDWWYSSSVNGSSGSAHWGQDGDIPRPSDLDGDGKADYIVFRPSNSTWYRLGSNSAPTQQPFGLAGDKPVTGDFNGDGKTDKAIYRPSTGDWWWQSSADGIDRATHWGISTDVPVPADYDGDGKTDFAVFRPSEGNWYVFNSRDFSYTILHWGIAEDKPVAADYDGDGKADIAVFRPSTGVWYLLRSTAGFTELPFGISTDVPTPNSFVPQTSSGFVEEKLKGWTRNKNSKN